MRCGETYVKILVGILLNLNIEIYILMPDYEPWKWNNNKYIRKSHNCYAYALDKIDMKMVEKCKKILQEGKTWKCPRIQPGNQPNNKSIKPCKIMKKRVLMNKNIKELKKYIVCPKGYYLIALTSKYDKTDYHFYRQDSNGLWSHKNSWRKATNKDAKGRLIRDPKKCDRRNFTIFCGYFIVKKK
jgi:hypothetical protein